MKKAVLFFNVLLTVLAIYSSFFNIVAGVALLNTKHFALGVKLIALTVVGYDIATLLVIFKKEITAGILSLASSMMLLSLRNDFINLGENKAEIDGLSGLELYNTRHLPSVCITAIILIFMIIKAVKVIKSVRRKRAVENRKKAPSIFN